MRPEADPVAADRGRAVRGRRADGPEAAWELHGGFADDTARDDAALAA